ncbi:hypothetical protein ABZ816_01575 [Actinosynnema sp. NPDC047251]|uniref:Uncharacterized protein n=1 Tax=Saccharothrix espanaensis (strain ATCC 51144 / DSM 44229 / JCM 9112 / NBRC 15066 / NRRL 15764) TaxID=1179773 RepID=K0JXS3_SACES|nr:hypothetical protein [Saccharothrix espanaensis]CCH30941.1 hypothetical protein BN6_36460 [Saccharothrix espanaensis DSM 44229]
MRITRTDGIEVGEWPHPERAALLEGRGAVLAWDVLGDAAPAARVHDPARAADWLWEAYGEQAAAGILGDAAEITARDWPEGRTLARLTWLEAWWPASAEAGVPALDPVVLLAERALATNAVEHLLDDEDATARALAAVPADPVVAGLSERLAALAEDYGIVLPAPVATRAEFALAAGGAAGVDGVTVHSGADPVDWALVPAGAVDAAADARWAVVRRGGGTFLDVVVPGGPRPDVPLAARFGPVDLPLEGTDDLGRRTGRAAVPPTVLLLPPAARRLTVYAPGFADPSDPSARPADPDAPARRAAIIAHARTRPDAPDATLTERLAGRR